MNVRASVFQVKAVRERLGLRLCLGKSGKRKVEKNLSELSASAVQQDFTAETQRRGGVFGAREARKEALGDLSASAVQTAINLGVGPCLAKVFMQKEVRLSLFQSGSYAGGHSC